MKGLKFDLRLSRVLLKRMGLAGRYALVRYREDWPLPALGSANEVLVKTRLGGVCATDLHQVAVDMSSFASVIAGRENPSPMGHELVGEVAEVGAAVTRVARGDRVVYVPIATCADYGAPLCPACARGNYIACRSFAGGGQGGGQTGEGPGPEQGGAKADTADAASRDRRGAGWGGGAFCEYLTGFEGQFFNVPAAVPDECAVLAEPFSVAIHAASRNLPSDDQTVLVIGAGIIGLMLVAALRSLGCRCRIISLARHPQQIEAVRRLGADEVMAERDRRALYPRVAAATSGELHKPLLGMKAIYGNTGPGMVFDCVGSERSMDDALHLVQSNGRIVVVGMGYSRTRKIDWAIQIYKEIEVVGSMAYGLEPYRGRQVHAFALALSIMERNPELFAGLVTHTFPISQYRRAFATARGKSRGGVIKTAFDYR